MWYHDRVEKRCQETTGTSDWHEAQKKLRERLQARDDNILHIDPDGFCYSFGTVSTPKDGFRTDVRMEVV